MANHPKHPPAQMPPDDGVPGGGLPPGMKMPRAKLHSYIRAAAMRARARKQSEQAALVPKYSSVLVADPDRFKRDMIAMICAATCGWHVIEAGSGREARTLFTERDPALIMLDPSIPELEWFVPILQGNRNDSQKIRIVIVHAGESALTSLPDERIIARINTQTDPLQRIVGLLHSLSDELIPRHNIVGTSCPIGWPRQSPLAMGMLRSTAAGFRDQTIIPQRPAAGSVLA